MQIVIDIPEELYKANQRGLESEELWDLRIAIKNGTPLPKGHGRLIDADELLKEHPKMDIYAFPSTAIESAKTIIEADKESEE